MRVNREKYEELSRGKPAPYCFEIKKGKRVLFYFGANHSHDLEDKQYPILRKFWKEFLKARSTKKLVVVEGWLREVRKSEKVAIKSGSEGALVTLLAHRANIPVFCPEPSRSVITAALKKKFSKEEVYYYYFAILIDSWRRHNPKPDFTEWMTEVMAIQAQRFGWRDFTLPKMKAAHKKLFSKNFNLKNLDFFNHIANPNRRDTVVNKVARTSSDIRDAESLKRFVKEWKAGKSLFIVYGSGHAFLHEPILKRRLK